MQVRKRDIVAIADAGLGGVGRYHAMAGIVNKSPVNRWSLAFRVVDRVVH